MDIKTRNAYYTAPISTFQKDVERDLYVEKMLEGGKLLPNTYNREKISWEENAKAISKLLTMAKLPNSDDVFISFEYAAPVGGRVDCVLFGTGKDGKKNVVLIELKQWGNQVEVYSDYGKCWVDVFVGGSNKTVDHPSEQAERYEIHFRNFIGLFDTDDYKLTSIAYCFNYDGSDRQKKKGLFDSMFDEILQNNPLYTMDDLKPLADTLHDKLCNGNGKNIAEALNKSEHKPTKALIDAAANMMIDPNDNTFVLLGEQDDAYKKFWSILKNTLDSNGKSVFIVKGGPGTGKTVIALKLLSELYKMGRTAFYATRSTALKKQLEESIKGGRGKRRKNIGGAQDLIRKNNCFRPSEFKESEIDVLLVDEAHRVEEASNDMNNKTPDAYSPFNQTLTLMYCAKVTVFFIDDQQAVKSSEIGISEKIKDIACNYQNEYINQIKQFKQVYYNKIKPEAESNIKKLSQEIDKAETDASRTKKIKLLNAAKRQIKWIEGLNHLTTNPLPSVSVYDYELTKQFRCVGADRFIQWVDKVLYNEVPNAEKFKLDKEDFDFQIVCSPSALEQKIRSLNNQEADIKVSARIVAGWCWEWSDKPEENGDLKREVQIGDWSMPWETKAHPKKEFRNNYARSAEFWAKDTQGVNQVGCVYSAQGFEFDYVGVIIGPDIKYDAQKGGLVCLANQNKERHLTEENADRLIRNIYRVLLTRGRKGCYMYSCDPEVSQYFKSFMNY